MKIGTPVKAAVPIEAPALYQEKPAAKVAPNRTLAAKIASMVALITRRRDRKASLLIGSRLAVGGPVWRDNSSLVAKCMGVFVEPVQLGDMTAPGCTARSALSP